MVMFDLAKEIIKGNPIAIARGISLVENESSKVQEVMKKIFPYTGRSIIVGITGAPGSGKSTLADKLIGLLKKEGKKIY